MAVASKLAFGDKPANLEPLEILLPRLLVGERPEYADLLAQYQSKAAGLLAEYRVYQNLGLLPIEEEFFYGQFLKILVTRTPGFDIRRLNLASWIQEKGADYFQRYSLALGFPAQLPPLFRWHYLFFDRVGEIAELLEDEQLSAKEKEEGLRGMGQEGRTSEVRKAAQKLVSRRLGGERPG